MTTPLVDASRPVSPAALMNAGIRGIGRYSSQSPDKAITLKEFVGYIVAGIRVFLAYEDGAGDILDQGLTTAHAHVAAQQMVHLGLVYPVLYWAADLELTAAQFPVAWDNTLTAAAISRTVPGAYGSEDYVSYCHDHGALYTWASAGWADLHNPFTPSIVQQDRQITLAGIQCDIDFGYADDYGQWPRGGDMRAVALLPTRTNAGYLIVGSDGGVYALGDAVFHGSAGQIDPTKPPGGDNAFTPAVPIVNAAWTSTQNGYWLLGEDGGVFPFGDAGLHGSLPGVLHPDPYS